MAAENNWVVVAAAGNGNGINSPAAGYNVISVGAAACPSMELGLFDYVSRPDAADSSIGPTANHRCKPDIIAPGIFAGPTANGESILISKPCSSFAVPYVSGAAGMLIDAARKNELENGDDARLIKSILMTGANKLIGWHKGLCNGDDDALVPLDYQQGAGLVDVSRSLDILLAGQYGSNQINSTTGWDINTIEADNNIKEYLYSFDEMLLPEQNFTATLCWNKHFYEDASTRGNILILTLWAVDEDGNLEKPLDISFSIRDNLQHIYFKNDSESRQIALTVTILGDIDAASETYVLSYHAGYSDFIGDELIGDVNSDGMVNAMDYVQILNATSNENYSNSGKEKNFYRYDLNFDCTVDREDLQIVIEKFGQQGIWLSPQN